MNLIWNLIFLWAAAAFAFDEHRKLEEYLCKDLPCHNGGTCTLFGYGPFCLCPPDYTGIHCQFLEKETTPKGKLPMCGGDRLMAGCDFMACVVDQDCPGNKSCCVTICGATLCYDPSCDKCEWSEWSKCEPEPYFHRDRTCGRHGVQMRTRKPDCCQNPEDRRHRQGCDLGPCPPCEMGLWGSWSACDVSCGTGEQRRSRSVHSWKNCDMPFAEDFQSCSLPDCPCVDESRQCANLYRPECGRTNAYEGMRNKTWNGLTCQYWDSQSPNKHRFSEVGHHNYCRSLDDKGGPWCYTTDGDYPYDFCFPSC